jgi:2-polyprenyl-3-methyl-5-hydroxy-6-metoxy-1,4-benzoquinol methylase
MIGEEFNLVQCKKCQLTFINPQPSYSEITKYYPDEYYVDAREWNTQRIHVKELQKRLDYLMEYYDSDDRRKLLDIGIFNGSFVSYALSSGWDAYGLDPNIKAISLAKKIVPNERLFHGYVQSSPFPPESFDVVTMWEVLEHATDPSDMLKKVHNLLAPNGIILISVPNFNSLESRLFGKYWNGLDVPRHLYHFTPHTISKMLEKTCFKKIFLKTINASQILEFANSITYGSESLRNVLMSLGLYPTRKGISLQETEKTHSSAPTYSNRQNWKKFLFRALETPFLKIINSFSAIFNSNNTIIAIGKKN